MTQDEFRRVLSPHLERLFAPLSFARQDIGYRLVRRADDVTQSIEIPVAVYPPKAHFSLLFGFRIEAAEQLYHRFSGVEPEYQPESETCVVNLEAIAPEVPRGGSRWQTSGHFRMLWPGSPRSSHAMSSPSSKPTAPSKVCMSC